MSAATLLQRECVDLVNRQLADTIDLRERTQLARNNAAILDTVLPRLLAVVNTYLERFIARLGEHVKDLGGVPVDELTAIRCSRLPRKASYIPGGADRLGTLSRALAALAIILRIQIDLARSFGDAVTADLLAQAWRELELVMWQVECAGQPEG